MNDMNTTDRALSWDDEFTNEQQEFVLLPEGDYAFEVTGMERARFEGSAKLPPCSMAKLTLKIFGGAKGDTTVTDRLYLHTKTQGLLGAFFESIGQCKRGETFRPRWNEVVGARGWCRLGIREYTKQSGPNAGKTGQSNEVTRFLPPPQPKAAPAQCCPPAPARPSCLRPWPPIRCGRATGCLFWPTGASCWNRQRTSCSAPPALSAPWKRQTPPA